MGYTKDLVLSADNFSYEEFVSEVENIERSFTKSVSKRLHGQAVWVTTHPFAQLDMLTKTTVSDYHDVYGNVDINFLTRFEVLSDNYVVMRLQEPKKKIMRGKLKFTPKNTLMLSSYVVGVNGDGTFDGGYCNYCTPVLQRESYLTTECDAAFANDAGDEAYQEIMENAWISLEQDKRFRKYSDSEYQKVPELGLRAVSYALQEALCIAADVKEMCGVTYIWNNILFIFPIHADQLKEVFKNRDKVDGRRRLILSVVKEHQRKEATVVKHIRTGHSNFTIDGREFGVFVGGEVLHEILKSNKQKELWSKKIKELEAENLDGGSFYTDKDTKGNF